MPAPDFSSHIEELLGLAGIANTPDARDDLGRCLQDAWGSKQLADLRSQSAPPELFKQLKTSIKKTQQLLRQLGRFPPTEDIEFERFCYLGTQKGLPRFVRQNPPINRQRVLDGLMRELDRSKPKRKRGGQRNETYQAVVGFAGLFFRQYSTTKLTTYPQGKFVRFCKLFYEIATGAAPLNDHMLDTQIRAEVESPRLGVTRSS